MKEFVQFIVFVVVMAMLAFTMMFGVIQCADHGNRLKELRECRGSGGRPMGDGDTWYCAKVSPEQAGAR